MSGRDNAFTLAGWLANQIYFVSDRTGTYNLFEFARRTRKITQLTSFAGDDIWFASASASGDAIVFVQGGAIHPNVYSRDDLNAVIGYGFKHVAVGHLRIDGGDQTEGAPRPARHISRRAVSMGNPRLGSNLISKELDEYQQEPPTRINQLRTGSIPT